MSKPNIEFIADLETIVKDRLNTGSDASYTARLASAGTKRIAQKVGEEGVELALAATAGDQQEVIDEAADLIYHLVVLLADAGLSLEDIALRLESRHSP
ncbi:MAG: phosphoribosyl-ATP diphosphatase [Gammaproteobacteria bacterium]|nr:phosphoribosyl-ATP diphosphatase [Gammaproteobacteria bacterium]